MKRLLILGLLALSGCSILHPQAPFDSVEYSEINRLYTYAELYKSDCSDTTKTHANFSQLSLFGNLAFNYSQDLPYNDNTIRAVGDLNQIVQSANQRIQTGTHSPKFCELELENIKQAAGTVKSAVAQRSR